MKAPVVVDTNVPIAASDRSAQASPDCVLGCQEAVLELMADRRRLVLDDDGLILKEYGANLSPSGQPGLGDKFLKWVLTNWANTERCDLVAITAMSANGRGFEEFPDAPGLEDFDVSDRKFVAVAKAHAESPPILQALDSKWWGWKDALAGAGILVEFLCAADVQTLYERKFGVAMPRRRQGRLG